MDSKFKAVITDTLGRSVAVRWADDAGKAIDHLKKVRKQEQQKTVGCVINVDTGEQVYATQ